MNQRLSKEFNVSSRDTRCRKLFEEYCVVDASNNVLAPIKDKNYYCSKENLKKYYAGKVNQIEITKGRQKLLVDPEPEFNWEHVFVTDQQGVDVYFKDAAG